MYTLGVVHGKDVGTCTFAGLLMTTPTNATVTSLEEEKKDAIRINVNVNSRMFTLPAFGAIAGLGLGTSNSGDETSVLRRF